MPWQAEGELFTILHHARSESSTPQPFWQSQRFQFYEARAEGVTPHEGPPGLRGRVRG